jgi:hypothetical protein
MSDAFYNRMAATASRLLDQFGTDVLIVRRVGQTVDPVTRQRTGTNTATFETRGILTEIKEQPLYASRQQEGERIFQGQRMLILTSAVQPKPKDMFMVGSEAINAYYVNPGYWEEGYTASPDMPTPWNAVEIMEKRPAKVPLVYMVRVSR